MSLDHFGKADRGDESRVYLTEQIISQTAEPASLAKTRDRLGLALCSVLLCVSFRKSVFLFEKHSWAADDVLRSELRDAD